MSKLKTILIIAYGTRGDVQPMVALGQGLRARGHRVRILASQPFQAWIERHGLEAIPAKVDVQEVMSSAGGRDWVEHGNDPIRQMQVMRKLLKAHGLEMALDGWQAAQGAEVLVSQFTSITYAIGIAEKLNIPHLSALLQPALIASRDGRTMVNAPLPGRLSAINYWMGKWLFEPVGWRLYGDITNQFRRETLGLPNSTLQDYLRAFHQTPTLMGFSPQVAPLPADWPAHYAITGYWFLDEAPHWEPPAALQQFLAAGSPPVYVGFGSMTGHGTEAIARLVVEAIKQSGQRGILAAGWAKMAHTDLPPTIFTLDEAPHDWLFPRMAAVAHHGGAGTTGAGFRAGVPTVIIPHMADQPFWGSRVQALGVGPAPIPRPQLTAEKLAAALREAATNPDYKKRAATLGAAIRAEDGVGQAVGLMEKYF